jgi:hypothetical protein
LNRGRLIIIAINALLLLVAVITLVIQHLTEPPGITATTTFTIEVTRSMTGPQILMIPRFSAAFDGASQNI